MNYVIFFTPQRCLVCGETMKRGFFFYFVSKTAVSNFLKLLHKTFSENSLVVLFTLRIAWISFCGQLVNIYKKVLKKKIGYRSTSRPFAKWKQEKNISQRSFLQFCRGPYNSYLNYFSNFTLNISLWKSFEFKRYICNK